MKIEEEKAEIFFKSIGFNNMIYEPKGNRTPDFQINDNIAIEVRRLNQFHQGEPLEDVRYNFIPKIINLIESFDGESFEYSAYFTIRYSRPIKYKSYIKDRIRSVLLNPIIYSENPTNYIITDNLELGIYPTLKRYKSKFIFGGLVDYDSGGFVLSNIIKSLKYIVQEKYNKTQPFENEYDEWWLALIDNIGMFLTETEYKKLRNSIQFNLLFDKVYLISSMNPLEGNEL